MSFGAPPGSPPPDWRPAGPPADRLDDVADVLLDLLSTVDRALHRYGVPPEHPVLAGLREFRALPGALARSIVQTDPELLGQQAAALARHRSAVLTIAEPVRADGADLQWSGAGEHAYRATWAPVSAALGADLPEQLRDVAAYGGRLARWHAELRGALVLFFRQHGNSSAAVTLRTGGPAPGGSTAGTGRAAGTAGAGPGGDSAGTGTADELAHAPAVATAAADLAAGCYDALRPALAAGQALRANPPSARPALPTARTPDHDTGTDSGAFHAGHD